jgi:hypothetical protein
MANFVFTRGIFDIFAGDTPLDSADFRLLLLDTDYVQDKNDNVLDDLDADEITVSGYARQTMANETLTEDDTNDRAYLDADDVTYTALVAGQTIGWAILYRHTGSDATAPTVAAYDVNDTPTNGGNVVIQWTAPGSGGVLYGA